jgi:DNA-binding PadR family transcriptional regulator
MSVRHGLLALLQSGEKYGYQLRSEFEAATGGTWPLNIGQVYTTLSRLDRDGLVAAAGAADSSGKVVYRITEAGEAELAAWFDAPLEHDARPRDELVIKVAMAIGTPGIDAGIVLDAQRAAAQRAIRVATRRKIDPATDLTARLVNEAAIFAAEAEVRWLDHCAALLRNRPLASAPVEPARKVTS